MLYIATRLSKKRKKMIFDDESFQTFLSIRRVGFVIYILIHCMSCLVLVTKAMKLYRLQVCTEIRLKK